jgi:hypothetical protein
MADLQSQQDGRQPRHDKRRNIVRYLPGWDSLDAVTQYHSWAELIGIGLLALLVVAELLSFSYGARKDDLTDEQQKAAERTHQKEMARLHRDTARLSADAEAAKAQIAVAQARASEADQKAERERLERVKLEAIVAPRHLTDDEKKEIIAALRPFAGQRVVVTSWSLDGEAWIIGQEIGECLTAAGITPIDDRGKFSAIGGYRFGIEVGGNSPELISAIVAALRDDGKLQDVSENADTAKMVLTAPEVRGIPNVAAAIFIGTKPLPSMTTNAAKP